MKDSTKHLLLFPDTQLRAGNSVASMAATWIAAVIPLAHLYGDNKKDSDSDA